MLGGLSLTIALAGLTGPSVSGQAPREWRDYAGGPDSSRFVSATAITKSNVGQLQVAWTYPAGQTDFNPLVVRGIVYGRGAEQLVRGARCGHGQAALDSPEGFEAFNVARRELLGKRGRQRPPAALRTTIPAGARRRDRPADPIVRRRTARWTCASGSTAIRRPSISRPARQDACSRTSSSWGPRPIRSTRRRPATSAPSTSARARWPGRFTPCRGPASSATRRGRPTRGRRSAAPTTGASSRSTRSAASSTSRPAAPSTTSTAATATAPISSATA